MLSFWGRSLLLLFFLFSPGANAEVTQRDFEDLLKFHVARIPELMPLWRNVNQAHEGQYTLGGGALRGLIHQLKQKVDSDGVQAAYKWWTPNLDNLLLQEWSDRDIVAVDYGVEWAKNVLPGFDVLSQSFHHDSIRAGGTTLEKVTVSPGWVSDPYGAIAAYLKGQLEFRPSPENAGHQNGLRGNSRLAQALRYLRMLKNLPETSPTVNSERELRQVAGIEWNSIRRGADQDYWILKGLKKLYHAHHKDPWKMVQQLQQYDMLGVLARHHYSLVGDEELYASEFYLKDSLQNKTAGWSLNDRMAAAEVMGRNPQERIRNLSWISQDLNQRQGIRAVAPITERMNLLRHIEQKFGGINQLNGGGGGGVGIKVEIGNGQVNVNGVRINGNNINVGNGQVVVNDHEIRVGGACLKVHVQIGQPRRVN